MKTSEHVSRIRYWLEHPVKHRLTFPVAAMVSEGGTRSSCRRRKDGYVDKKRSLWFSGRLRALRLRRRNRHGLTNVSQDFSESLICVHALMIYSFIYSTIPRWRERTLTLTRFYSVTVASTSSDIPSVAAFVASATLWWLYMFYASLWPLPPPPPRRTWMSVRKETQDASQNNWGFIHAVWPCG